MKKKILRLVLIVSVILAFSSCQNNVGSEEVYTVWTDLETYSEFQSTFGRSLDDGMYIRLEFTSSQWNQISSSLTSEGRHSWTKSQIKDWFLGRGFGDYESTKESAWMTTIEHGFIASRTRNIVYFILK
ncbi:MAG: hypothetical protein J6I73_03790 [Treponema sp.]|nr:hypothetical protein [Treponema sp.]